MELQRSRTDQTGSQWRQQNEGEEDDRQLGPAPSRPTFESWMQSEAGPSRLQEISGRVALGGEQQERTETSETMQLSMLSARQAFVDAIQRIIDPLVPQNPFNDSTEDNSMDLLTKMKSALANIEKTPTEIRSTGLPATLDRPPTEVEQISNFAHQLSSKLSTKDAKLIERLCTLLGCIDRLITLSGGCKSPAMSRGSSIGPLAPHADLYNDLARESEAVRSIERTERDFSQNSTKTSSSEAEKLQELKAAEQAVLWARVDDLVEEVQHICRQSSTQTSTNKHSLKSDYDESDFAANSAQDGLPQYSPDEEALPPGYIERLQAYADEKVDHSTTSASEEKGRLELDLLSSAIGRLYDVAPQLANQRVDGSSRKGRKQIREMQLVRLGTAIERLSKGRLEDQRASLSASATPLRVSTQDKGKAAASNELEMLLDAVQKASGSDMINQRVALTPRQYSTLSEARKTAQDALTAFGLDPAEIMRRDYILSKTGSGRLDSQDADADAAPRVMQDLANRPLTDLQMRRRSLSQPTVKVKCQCLEWHAVHQKNLNRVVVRVWPVDSKLDVRITGNKQLSIHTTTINLPISLRHGAHPVIKTNDDHSTITLDCEESNEHSIPGSDVWPAYKLSMNPPAALQCRECSQILIHGNQLEYSPLPSEHWAELLDAWVCHQDEQMHSSVLAVHNEGFRPRESQILVGSCHFLVTVATFVKSATVLQGDSIACSSCQTEVGTKTSQNSTIFRLPTYNLEITGPGWLNLPAKYHVSARMLELREARGVHRFVLESRDSESGVLIWIFNASLLVTSSNGPTSKQHMHVLYRPLTESATSGPPAEKVELPTHMLSEFVSNLSEANSRLPYSLRVQDTWRVAYLQRP